MLYKKVVFGGLWGGGGARRPIIHVRLIGSQLVFSEQQLLKYARMITVIRSGLVVSWGVQPCQGRHEIHLSQNERAPVN